MASSSSWCEFFTFNKDIASDSFDIQSSSVGSETLIFRGDVDNVGDAALDNSSDVLQLVLYFSSSDVGVV